MKNKKVKKSSSAAKKWLLHFICALIIFTGGFIGIQYAMSAAGSVSIFTADPSDDEFELVSIVDSDNPFFETFSGSKRINILILGLNDPLTDTIMLASFDPDLKRVDLISIPRDTYYLREGYDNGAQKKINSAYVGKPINSAKAVSDILQGMPIHYYALAEFKGIEKIVDSMNGIPVNVPFHLRYNDPDDKPPLNIDIPAGEQVLMGKDAVDYLRFRKSNVKGYKSYAQSDLDREMAQQDFLKSAFQQSIGHLPSVVTSVHKNVKSNIDLKTALKIATKSVGMSKDDIYSYVLPGEAKLKGLWYYFADEEATKVMIEEIYNSSDETESLTTDGAVE